MPEPYAASSGRQLIFTFAEYKCFSLLAVLESNVSLLFTNFDMIETSKSIIEVRTNYGPIRL